MYSEEIKKLVELKNNLLSVKEYCDIVDTSPQIDHIKYENELFNIYTNDNFSFKIKIKH